MGKRVVLAIFGGIALLGLIVMIVGVAMGGQPGAIRIKDGSFAYVSPKETIPIGNAPYWASNWGHRYSPFVDTAIDAPEEILDAPTGNGKFFTMGDPMPAGQALKGLEIDIDAGYVIIQAGDEPGMVVDGDMTYTTTTEDGVWKIEANFDNITSRGVGRFWLNGKDITTTFTITVPERLQELEIELGMGEVTVDGLTVQELDGKVDLGSLSLSGVTATESELTVNMGSIEAYDFYTDLCKLKCDMGGIEVHGSVATKLEADCSMGSIYAMLERPSGYTVDSEVSLGSISVDGSHHGAGFSSGSHHSEGDGSVYFDLECGMGSIEIDFT